MADLNGIGNLLQGVGAGFSGQLPQLMVARTQQQEQDALADDRRRKALIRDFATGYTLISNGQVDQAKTLFTHRLDMLKKLNAPDMSDTQGIVDRLDAGNVDEVAKELGSFVQAAQAVGEFGDSRQGYNSTASNQMFKDGSVLQANRDGTTTFRDPSGQLLEGEARQAALNRAIASGVWLAGQEAGARANATEAAQTAAVGPQARNAAIGANEGDMGYGGAPSKAAVATSVADATASTARGQTAIDAGVTAGQSLPTLIRAGH